MYLNFCFSLFLKYSSRRFPKSHFIEYLDDSYDRFKAPSIGKLNVKMDLSNLYERLPAHYSYIERSDDPWDRSELLMVMKVDSQLGLHSL